MRNLAKNESGISPVIGVFLMVAIVVILVSVVVWFALGGSNTETNKADAKIKNPNITFANDSGMVIVRGDSPEEVNARIGEIRKIDCYSNIMHAAEYDPIRKNFYATVFISTRNRCIKLYS